MILYCIFVSGKFINEIHRFICIKMAVNAWKSVLNNYRSPSLNFIRNGQIMHGKVPGVARTLQQRLAKRKPTDPLYTTRIDIGFSALSVSRSEQLPERIKHIQKQRKDINLEKLARNQELLVDLDEVHKDWLDNNGAMHIKRIAEHYGVYEHLYNEGYFIPRVNLNVFYSFSDVVCPVHYGNVITPLEAAKAPEVNFVSEENNLWVLTLINLDGHLTETGKEYIHWCVANIPGNEVAKGDTIVQYLQPIPPKGTGFHRYVFVLYKQNQRIDFSIKPVKYNSPLQDRTFTTREWYKKYEDDITPAGLAFFQSEWDPSLTSFFYQNLDMKEPVFEYDFPKPYIKPQEWFALKQPFNIYMDKYRDPKQIAKEYLLRKLKTEDPFKKPDPPLKYPNAQRLPADAPSWLKLHEKKIRLGWGRVKDF